MFRELPKELKNELPSPEQIARLLEYINEKEIKMIDIRQQTLSEDLKRQIYEGFSRHAIQMTGYDEKFDAVAFVAMDGISLAGAIVVERFWGALHVKYVYIVEKYRGRGLGSRLMQSALSYGIEQKCPFAFVETMSFQALEFYQKMGFELDFTRTGYAHGTSFHYLSRKIADTVCTNQQWNA